MLPWRETQDPYRIWVSEVMLQQTRVDTVIPYYRRFIERFPRINDLGASREISVLKLWEGLGYYSRARHLRNAAQIVVKKHNSRIPDTWDEFHRLPGVGDYICAAVLSIAFDRPYAVVDGNVKRVLARVLGSRRPVNASGSHNYYQKKADIFLRTKSPGTFNQAMMELGALVCTPRGPLCKYCPVSKFCRALSRNMVSRLPRKKSVKKVPTHRIATAVVRRNGRLLITRRASSGLLGGLWEFPGGRIENRETAEQACLRELKEETNIRATVCSHLGTVRHAYSHFRIHMDVFLCDYKDGRIRLNGPVDSKWVWPSQLKRYPFPKANLKFMGKLIR